MSEYYIYPVSYGKIAPKDGLYKPINFNKVQKDLVVRPHPETDSLILKIGNKPMKHYAKTFKTEIDEAKDLEFKRDHITRLPNDPFGLFDKPVDVQNKPLPQEELKAEDITDKDKLKGVDKETRAVDKVSLSFHPAASRGPGEIMRDTLKEEGLKEEVKSGVEEVMAEMNLIWESEAKAQEDKMNRMQTRSRGDPLTQEEIRTKRRRESKGKGVVKVAPVYDLPRKVMEDADKKEQRKLASLEKLDAVVDEKMEPTHIKEEEYEKAHMEEAEEEAAERLAQQLEAKRQLEAGEEGFVSQQIRQIDEKDFVKSLKVVTQKHIEEIAESYGVNAPRRYRKDKQIELLTTYLKTNNIPFGDVIVKVIESDNIKTKVDPNNPISSTEEQEESFKETILQMYGDDDVDDFLKNLKSLDKTALVDIAKNVIKLRNINYDSIAKVKLLVRMIKAMTDDPAKYGNVGVRMMYLIKRHLK